MITATRILPAALAACAVLGAACVLPQETQAQDAPMPEARGSVQQECALEPESIGPRVPRGRRVAHLCRGLRLHLLRPPSRIAMPCPSGMK